jgi:hypothetical protein
MAEKENLGIFDNSSEIGSLFESITETPTIDLESDKVDLFSDKEEKKEEIDEKEVPSLFEEKNSEEDTDTETKIESSSFGEAIQLLIKSNDEFLVYEGDEEGKTDYTPEQFVDLYQQNLKVQSEKMAETILEQAISQLSPTMQKVLAGEFKGVNISDLVKELSDYQEIEKLPENPTPEDKEKIVRLYYNRLAKEKNKDAEWASKQVEKIIDRDELESEFEDAKAEISQDLENKQKEKEQAIALKQKEKEDFKKYHTYFVNEALKEDNLFGINLSKSKKEQVANVLSTFAVRPTDKKEKLGLTALIDSYIHSENPKETYKILALMSLAAVAPNELVEQLKVSAEKKVTNETIKKLKVADKVTPLEEKKKSTFKKPGNIF